MPLVTCAMCQGHGEIGDWPHDRICTDCNGAGEMTAGFAEYLQERRTSLVSCDGCFAIAECRLVLDEDRYRFLCSPCHARHEHPELCRSAGLAPGEELPI